MSKNILIFSDGTGQAGGLKPDQQLSNIYKLYRATRVGPDSSINPEQQIAFYDAGLGTGSNEGSIPLRIVRFVRKFVSAAFGYGITRNITDCYETIIKHYEPGDRIFLFGFSRGAYTVRCVAGVLNLCGVPTRAENKAFCPRYGKDLRAIAVEAVEKVYEHGAGRDRAKFEQEREEQAKRFREKYGSDVGGKANIQPYFIGVFDTVAALGAKGFKRFSMLLGIFVFGVITSLFLAKILSLIFYSFDLRYTFFAVFIVGAIILGLPVLRSSFKVIRDFPVKGDFKYHFAGWRSGFYDKYLAKEVRFGRHALAIDETRSAFARVPWGVRGDSPERNKSEPEWFQQIWFAGNHSDIGGSYPEDESRLSDISLDWMTEQATSIPFPIIIDKTKLQLFPSPAGMQHCEVSALADQYPSWIPTPFRFSWKQKVRTEVLGAPLHSSVRERFKIKNVLQYNERKPYRPNALKDSPELIEFYKQENE